ncbi:MAG: hypothetical protein RUMPE_01210 [Eubacteriales bacterium SKADARSKE-1]|nr:hypothetical protein [Eubacteriales bacterium SKADARSKE-1]
MTLKEFADQNPDLIQKAGECKTKEEFAQFAKEHGVEIPKETLNEAYAYVCAQGDGELNEDSLESVAGGKYKAINSEDVYKNDKGQYVVKK